MTPTPSPARAPRNPFLDRPEPEPFHRTPEFQRLLVLAGALVVAGLLAWYFAATARSKAESARAEAERAARVPPLLGPEQQEERERRLSTLFEGALGDTRNGDDFMETTGYRRLLEILISYPEEEILRKATRRLDWDAAMADPDAWRGEFVWTRGIVAEFYAVKLSDPVLGHHDVYQGILTEADGEQGVFFDTPDPLPPLELRKEPVDVYGIFYRTVRYVTFREQKQRKDAQGQPLELSPHRTKTAEGDVQEAPYLLVKTIRRVENPRRDTGAFLKDHTGILLVGMGLAIGAVHLLVLWFQRRSKRRASRRRAEKAGFRELFEKRVKEDRGAAGPRPPA